MKKLIITLFTLLSLSTAVKAEGWHFNGVWGKLVQCSPIQGHDGEHGWLGVYNTYRGLVYYYTPGEYDFCITKETNENNN